MNTRVLSIIVVSYLLASCSAAILSIGEEEYSVIHRGSTKKEIVGFLGEPINTVTLAEPKSIIELRKEYPFLEFLGFPAANNPNQSPNGIRPEVPAALREQYSYIGRIQRKTGVGEAVALAGYTWGLSELIMIPTAIKMQVERSHQIHMVTVWYSETNVALAYLWETVPKNE